jgi:hypothetical protein
MENLKYLLEREKCWIERVIEETANFDRLIRGCYETIAEQVFNTRNPSGIAAFAYGSPGRIELVGGESDADIFLAEKERTQKTAEFRKRFKKYLEKF